MGEQAELILNGDVCEGCGENFDDEGEGYPRRCSACGGGSRPWKGGQNPIKQERMKEAERLFKAAGFTWKTFNKNYHWCVEGVDFFPTTGRWLDTKRDHHGQGVKECIKYVKDHKCPQDMGVRMLSVEEIFDVAKKGAYTSLYDKCVAIHKAIYGKKGEGS